MAFFIDNKLHYTAKDFRDDFIDVPDDSLVYAIWHDKDGNFHTRSVYKIAHACDDSQSFIYLGDEVDRDGPKEEDT